MTQEELEKLADLGILDLTIRIKVLDKIIQEARANGDERWKDVARDQVEPLNDALGIAKQRERARLGLTEPEPIVIQTKVGILKPRDARKA